MSLDGGLVPLSFVAQRGIRHELDPSGSWCARCGELAEWLLEQGGEGGFD